MNIIVIGAGITGLSTAFNLAHHGANVTLMEQGEIPHDRAASFDQHRIIRHFYPDSDAYGRLVEQALAAWNRLWRRIGRIHFSETGVLAISTKDGDWSDRSRGALERIGIAHEKLSRSDLQARLPQLSLPEHATGLFTPGGGALFADRICTDLARNLRQNAVDLLPKHRVVEIETESGRVITESGEAFKGDRILIAGGAWIGNIVPALARKVTTYRQAVLYLTPPSQWAAAWRQSPVIVDFGGTSGAYALPPINGCDLKIAVPAHRRLGDPDKDMSLDFDEAETILNYVRGDLIDADQYRQLYLKTCFYTVAPEDRFQLHSDGRLIAYSGCSGHGFKFGALAGEMLAEVLLGKADAEQVGRILGGY
jgi:sarcosine oxidase